MKFKLLFSAGMAVAMASAAPAIAQDINANSGSNSAANSGSQSASSSDANHQNQGQVQSANNAGIGTSRSVSGSESTSNASTDSRSFSDQGQSQTQGQMATNQQGVTVNQTWNSTQRKRTYVATNDAVPLAASSSFSSDYCGGTVSGGASAAPIGISIGGAAPKMDKSCQYLRVAEKAGMLGANYHNAGYIDMAGRAFMLEAWATCMAGPDTDHRNKGDRENGVMSACVTLGLLGSDNSVATPPSLPAPEVSAPPEVTPEATQKYYKEKTPRGELEYQHNPVIQPAPEMAVAGH